MAREPANRTGSASFADELTLDLPASLGDGHRVTPLAAKASFPATQKGGVTMPWTSQICLLQTGLSRGSTFPTSSGVVGVTTTATQPIASRRVADPQFRCDLPNRSAIFGQFAHSDRVNRAFRCMASLTNRPQPVLLQPVADCRGVLARTLSDRLQRHSRSQALFQPPLVHAWDALTQCRQNDAYAVRSCVRTQLSTRCVWAIRSTRAARSRLRVARRS